MVDPARSPGIPTAIPSAWNGSETKDAVVRYADRIHQGWTAFVLETSDRELASLDPVIETPRGALPYSALLSAQRWHAAFHYRQLTVFLTGQGVALSEPVALDRFTGLGLPPEVF